MSIQKVEMTVERIENGQYVEQIAYPYVEYEHVTMENGMDIMSMIRDDVSTPMVTHNTTSWKVGQGDSDVSESIVDSSVGDMTIKGQTYQNILPSPSLRNSMTIGKTMQKLNEGYDSVNTVDGVCKSAILKGNTLLVDELGNECEIPNSPKITLGAWINTVTGVETASVTSFNTGFLKCQTVTFIVKGNNKYKRIVFYDKNKKFISGIDKQVGDNSNITINSTQIPSNAFYLRISASINTDGVSYTPDTKLLIEDVSGNNLYSTQLVSVKMPVLTTTGKNLFDGDYVLNDGRGRVSIIDYEGRTCFSITGYEPWHIKLPSITKFKSNTITLSFEYIGSVRIYGIKEDGSLTRLHELLNKTGDFVRNKYTLTVSDDYVDYAMGENIAYIDLNSIQVEYGTQATSHEPYKSNILSCNEEVTLRGNGEVKDTLDGNTGELTQRIGEVVLEGSENWVGNANFPQTDTHLLMQTTLDDTVKNSNGNNMVCDKMQATSYAGFNNKEFDFVCVGKSGSISNLFVKLSKDKLVSFDKNGFNNYFSQNPITVQYELETPTVKTVVLSILDQDNQPIKQLNSFANGYIQVSSQEGTLIPTTEYEVPTSNSYHVDLMKANTQYTMKNMQSTFTIDGIQYNASVNGTFTSPSTLSNRLMITNVVQTQPMLLEGDMTSKEVPYVEGIKSAFEGVDKVEIVSQNADNSLSNTTSFQLAHPLRSLPNGVRDEIVLDRVNHKAKIVQRVGEDLTQLDTPIVTEVNLEGYPYVYKDGHIFLNT